jgi:hypothetical protein
MSNIPYTITESAIVLMIDAKTYTVKRGDDRFNEVREAIRTQNFDVIPTLLDIKGKLISDTNGGLYLLNGMLRCADYDVPSLLASRIIAMVKEGFSVEPLTNFLGNLMENPSTDSQDELYGFIEACSLPITADGHFLAYKMVTKDFKDICTKSMDNSIGAKPEMPRDQVDANRNRTCSTGLHFCSEGYLGHYGHEGNSQVVILKINPRDVVSIPTDYNNAKGRACTYEIVDAIDWDELITPLFTDEYSGDDAPTPSPEVDSETFYRWELRDSETNEVLNGFVSRKDAREERAEYDDIDTFIYDALNNVIVVGKCYVDVTVPFVPDEADNEDSLETSDNRWEVRDSDTGALIHTYPSRAEARFAVEDDQFIWDNQGGLVSGRVDPSIDLTDLDGSAPAPTVAPTGTKLNDTVVSKIKRALSAGKESCEQLARDFGVSSRTIRRIRDGESWSHVQIV